MPSLRHHSTLVVLLNRQPHLAHLRASRMKMCKVPELLKKAVTLCRSKTDILAARFLFLVSLRRRMATIGAISHRIHGLVAATDRQKGSSTTGKTKAAVYKIFAVCIFSLEHGKDGLCRVYKVGHTVQI
jgi:hypothetical protein